MAYSELGKEGTEPRSDGIKRRFSELDDSLLRIDTAVRVICGNTSGADENSVVGAVDSRVPDGLFQEWEDRLRTLQNKAASILAALTATIGN